MNWGDPPQKNSYPTHRTGLVDQDVAANESVGLQEALGDNIHYNDSVSSPLIVNES